VHNTTYNFCENIQVTFAIGDWPGSAGVPILFFLWQVLWQTISISLVVRFQDTIVV
jgi:hypothetical protein